MGYIKEIKEVDGIIGCTTTKIKNGNRILCTVNATQKTNQARLAELVSLLGMNIESKNFLLHAIREKVTNQNGEIPSELKKFHDVFELFV